MKLAFTKMHGLGNDFVVVDARKMKSFDGKTLAARVLDRRFGIGGDQFLVILPSKTADVRMAIFESTGQESEMCGNGIRCIGRYLAETGVKTGRLRVETLAGERTIEVHSNDRISVDMGRPEFSESLWGKTLNVDGHSLHLYAVSMGNPHAVTFVERESDLTWASHLGPKIETHEWFPNRTNVEFVYPVTKSHLIVRVWERGAGATLACGTGACAAAVAAIRLHLATSPLKISYVAGDLEMKWREGETVTMTGSAARVFDGEMEI